MADKLFELFKKESEKKSALVAEISIKCTNEELDVLYKKANAIGVDASELFREYVLKECSVFDPVIGEKKAPKKEKKVSNNDA
jgi:acetone carboxylase gamma subunit